jgi:hypothetical protein
LLQHPKNNGYSRVPGTDTRPDGPIGFHRRKRAGIWLIDYYVYAVIVDLHKDYGIAIKLFAPKFKEPITDIKHLNGLPFRTTLYMPDLAIQNPGGRKSKRKYTRIADELSPEPYKIARLFSDKTGFQIKTAFTTAGLS